MPSRIGIITSVLSNEVAAVAGGVAWARAGVGPVAAIASDRAQAIRRDRTTKRIMTRELPSEARNDEQAAIVHRIGRPRKRPRGRRLRALGISGRHFRATAVALAAAKAGSR